TKEINNNPETAPTSPGLTSGRRTLAATGAAVLVAVSVCAAVALSRHHAVQDSQVPVTPAASLADFPSTMVSATRNFLGGSDLGPATVASFSSHGARLAAGHVDDARSLDVSFGSDSTHSWKLYVGPSGQGADSPTTRCDSVLGASLLSCDTGKAPDGGTAVTTVVVLRLNSQLGSGIYSPADVKSLTDGDLPDLRVERNVRVFHPSGSMTSVTETVVAPKSLDPAAVFSSSLAQMTKLATDPDVEAVPAK
ncbi:MAG: hypothetical protein JWP74_2489, partial [Marmoricola sp.]|nr:hypothetical protein [Marmoricola sp.]